MVRLTCCFLCWQIQIIWFLSLSDELAGAGQGKGECGEGTGGGCTWHRQGYMKVWFSKYLCKLSTYQQSNYAWMCLEKGVILNGGTLAWTPVPWLPLREKLFSLFVLQSVTSEGKGCLLFLSFTANIFSVAKTNLSPERLSLKLSLTAERQYLHCAQFLIV